MSRNGSGQGDQLSGQFCAISVACFCYHISPPSVERGLGFDLLLPFLQTNQASILE